MHPVTAEQLQNLKDNHRYDEIDRIFSSLELREFRFQIKMHRWRLNSAKIDTDKDPF
jgi:hypothetical protein